jgi:ankyrin repeat protein
VNVRDRDGKTPMDVASNNKNVEVVRLLTRHAPSEYAGQIQPDKASVTGNSREKGHTTEMIHYSIMCGFVSRVIAIFVFETY